MDHSFANLQSLMYLRQAGKNGCIVGAKDRVYLLFGGETLTLPREEGVAVSVFSYGEQAEGVTFQGLYYPLQDARLINGFPLGVSNHFAAPSASITLTKGSLLVMVSQI